MKDKSPSREVKDQAPLALYLHIPFCLHRCTYCDFNTYAGLEDLFLPYVTALATEVRQAGRGERVATIFFGGGTPSILPEALVAELLTACYEAYAIDADAEISLEANPDTVHKSQLAQLRRSGINRLSLGIQSARPEELTLLGRLHTFNQAAQTAMMARTVGFENLSLDLIYGLPGQTLSHWTETLEAVLTPQLRPEHLSAYCLTVEQGTLLAHWIASNQVPRPDPDRAAEMYELTERILENSSFTQYEISNWAQPGYECRHNLVYWQNETYLGFGAGAHSYRGGRRWWNVPTPAEYIARVKIGDPPEADSEIISPAQAMGETMMLGLRLNVGVSTRAFQERFGQPLDAVYGRELEELIDHGLIEWDDQRVRLKARGRLLGNQVFARFLP